MDKPLLSPALQTPASRRGVPLATAATTFARPTFMMPPITKGCSMPNACENLVFIVQQQSEAISVPEDPDAVSRSPLAAQTAASVR